MSGSPHDAAGVGVSPPRPHPRDRGSSLVLVLVLVVVAGLVVVPLMGYATSVLKLNSVVSEHSKQVEASKAGLRLALADVANVFKECDDGGTLTSPTINGIAVTTTCEELQEIGPLEALGYEVPIGAVALQLGAEVPATALGGSAQSDPVPPYPATADWWTSQVPTSEPWDPETGTVWLPELPRWPSTLRSPTPYSMPAAFTTGSGIECKVFFPGNYDQPIDLNGSVNYYFASGVYYFSQPITVSENADVVVGYGLEDFVDRPASEVSACADDLQVATNVVAGPDVKLINGGGATWVFGDEARLIVDDSAGSPSIRFNQRYAEQDRGGRVSIMTVNGVSNGTSTADPHDVPMVNYVPVSQYLETIDTANDVSQPNPINALQFVPSSQTFTDAARVPLAPNLTATPGRYQDASSTDRGAIRLVWDVPLGNEAGGALVDGYEITVDGSPACDQQGDIVYLTGTGTAGRDQLTCYAEDQSFATHTVTVATTNFVGTGPAATATVAVANSGSRDERPEPVNDVTVEETDVDDVARVRWTEPDDSDAPVVGYTAAVDRVSILPQPAEPPTVPLDAELRFVGNNRTATTHLPVTDANGDPFTVTIDASTIPAGWTVQPVAPNSLDVTVTTPTTGAPLTILDRKTYQVAYTVTSGADVVNGTLTLAWRELPTIQVDPTARDFTSRPELGTPVTHAVPVDDLNGGPFTLTVDTSALDPAELIVTASGTDVTITALVADGTTYSVPYTVRDLTGRSSTGVIQVVMPTTLYEEQGSCQSTASSLTATEMSCEITGLADLDATFLGYRARVVAESALGPSDPAYSPIPYPTAFDGGGTAAPTPAEREVVPWAPEPVIDIRAGGSGAASVRIGGYVSVPMGRIRIENPDGDANDTVELIGGTAAGTYELLVDDVDSVVGFRNDIVLQRKLRITSRTSGAVSTAIVQVNEDGAGYAVNSWVVK